MYWGYVDFSNYLLGYDWHIHEMLFGFVAAVLAGFLLTATRAWTKQPTASGGWLAALVVVWLAGRICVLLANSLPPVVVAAVDLPFLPLVAIVVGRAVVVSRNKRNVGVVVMLLLLSACNAAMHAKAFSLPLPRDELGAMVGVDLVVVFLALIGGRVVPTFTKNATPDLKIRNSRLVDGLSIGLLVVMAALDVFEQTKQAAAVCALAAGLVHALRLSGWGGLRTLSRPILWVLHLGYLWIVIGLLLKGVAGLSGGLDRTAASHALTSGAMTTMIIGMMARVALGHTGRKLEVARPITVAFVLVTLAALIRVVLSAFKPDWYPHSLTAAAAVWSLAFLLYLIVYTPILIAPRADGTRDWRVAP